MNRSRTTLVALGIAVTFASALGPAQDAPKASPAAAASPAPKPKPASEPEPAARGARPGDVQKVFAVHHVSAGELRNLLRVFPAQISAEKVGTQQVIAVSAAPAVVAAIEETIKRLDVPSPSSKPTRSVELTVWVLEALGKADASAGVPADLDGVVTQLKRTFNFESYRLADTLVARARDGSGFDTAVLGNKFRSSSRTVSYILKARRVLVVPGDGPSNVHVDELNLGADVPTPAGGKGPDGASWSTRSVGTRGDVDVREGQRVVVGKTGIGDEDGNGLIFVLSAKLVD